MTEISLRDQLARKLGSLPMHDDDQGPDNTVLVDLLPFTPGEGEGGETMLYRIVDAILALPALTSAQAGEAAARVRVGELEGALEPFAKVASDELDVGQLEIDCAPDDMSIGAALYEEQLPTCGDFRRAREAVRSSSPEGLGEEQLASSSKTAAIPREAGPADAEQSGKGCG